MKRPATQPTLLDLVRALVAGDDAEALRLLAAAPELATVRAEQGATRQEAAPSFFEEILHYIYAGDTALHMAAAAYRVEPVRALIARGADLHARNRRGATPLHYAVDGGPNAPHWNPHAQVATIRCLLDAGADPNAIDKGGVTPLHRAARNRCADAVAALLDGGADPARKTRAGSTPLSTAMHTTGRGGSGSPEAKEQQAEIVRLLGGQDGDRRRRR